MLDDYELLYLSSDRNEDALKALLTKYEKNIYLKSLKFNPNKIDFDDYLNEAMIAFYEAIENYSSDDKSKFITYLNICLDRKLQNYKKLENRKKHSILKNSISIEDLETSEEFLADNRYNPQLIIEEEDNYEYLKNKILKSLSAKGELVFLLKEQNYTIKEISQILGKSQTAVYSLLNEIRKKISKLI